MTWRVARSLDVLLAELNAGAPNRSKISDGSIGDASHASRSSDHNPWVIHGGVGIVRARDFTHDPRGGLDCNWLAGELADLIGVHPALGSGGYIIWNRRIFSADRRGEGWRSYSGSNPHDHHLHVSVATSPGGFDSTQPWIEDDMNEADTRRIAREEAAKLIEAAVADAFKDAADDIRVDIGKDNKWSLARALKVLAKRSGK